VDDLGVRPGSRDPLMFTSDLPLDILDKAGASSLCVHCPVCGHANCAPYDTCNFCHHVCSSAKSSTDATQCQITLHGNVSCNVTNDVLLTPAEGTRAQSDLAIGGSLRIVSGDATNDVLLTPAKSTAVHRSSSAIGGRLMIRGCGVDGASSIMIPTGMPTFKCTQRSELAGSPKPALQRISTTALQKVKNDPVISEPNTFKAPAPLTPTPLLSKAVAAPAAASMAEAHPKLLAMVHAKRCQDSACQQESCRKMKQYLNDWKTHASQCKARTEECKICRLWQVSEKLPQAMAASCQHLLPLMSNVPRSGVPGQPNAEARPENQTGARLTQLDTAQAKRLLSACPSSEVIHYVAKRPRVYSNLDATTQRTQ